MVYANGPNRQSFSCTSSSLSYLSTVPRHHETNDLKSNLPDSESSSMKRFRPLLQRWPSPSKRLTSRAVWARPDPRLTFWAHHVHARFITSTNSQRAEEVPKQKTETRSDGSQPIIPRTNSESLRILFFGSDDFSVAALRTIHEARAELGIDSIDVVCRPGKRYGRGLKRVSEVPVKQAAEELQLPVHETDSFEDWEAPIPEGGPVNLLLAVSFGLLIPGKLINAAKYGGLNLHPSMLPDLRGAAPLQHALLLGRKDIAVTLQTLHPTKFDHGVALSQTEPLRIPRDVRESCSPEQLRKWITPIATDHLKNGLEQRLFLEPHKDVSHSPDDKSVFPDGIARAPKFTKEDGHIDWKTWTSDKIVTRQKVLGSVWNDASITFHPKKAKGETKKSESRRVRMIFTDVVDYTNKKYFFGTKFTRPNLLEPLPPGSLEVIVQIAKSKLGIWTCDQRFLWVKELVLEGAKQNHHPVASMQWLRIGTYKEWKDKVVLE